MVSLPVILCFLLLGISSKHAYGQEADEISQVQIEPESEERRNYNSNLSHEILISDLGSYVNNETGREHLKEDFDSVREGQRKPCVASSLPENKKKDRYDDLCAYDETRFVLRCLPNDSNSDYINANFINGYYQKKEYIATQGPLNNTICDFWRMIWQQKTDTIVMVANFKEHDVEKVAMYLPETSRICANINVTKISEVRCKDHIIRTFKIQKVGSSKRFTLRHIHYTNWPDFGVPVDHCAILAALQQARKYHLRKRSNKNIPLVVHCSAGVGRTGTVILTDSELQRAMNEGYVDLLKRLDIMREQRINVVEKAVQYIWAHEAIYQWFYGNATRACVKEYEACYNSSPELRSETESAESTGSTLPESDEISTVER